MRKRVVVKGITKWVGEPLTIEHYKKDEIPKKIIEPRIDRMIKHVLTTTKPFCFSDLTEKFGLTASSHTRDICKYLRANEAIVEVEQIKRVGSKGRPKVYFNPEIARELNSKNLFTKELILTSRGKKKDNADNS